MSGTNVLLEVKDLVKWFPIRGGLFNKPVNFVKAVDGVSFFCTRGGDTGIGWRVRVWENYYRTFDFASD